MIASPRLLAKRRFLPLFVTQFLGAFNDNLFRTAMILLVTYTILRSPAQEAGFSAIAGGLFILPFFLLSALAGQIADGRDKARIVRIVKSAEIGIMLVGAAGLLLHSIPTMLAALFAMGMHSTFFGPIKYAILPQHLEPDEVLAGTGLIEAGTYAAILLGTIVGGLVAANTAAGLVLAVAIAGRLAGSMIPPAPSLRPDASVDLHVVRASATLVNETLHIPSLFMAIVAISFFWGMGAVLAAQFPPLVKNVLHADKSVATLFLAIFSIGVAAGSLIINRLLSGRVSAKFAPGSALVMGIFVCDLFWSVRHWPVAFGPLLKLSEFMALHHAERVMLDLLGIALFGGMFVVPLYAFLTTSVPKSQTARTVAANNIVNAGAMVTSTTILAALVHGGLSVADSLLIVAVLSVGAAAIAWKLHRACDRSGSAEQEQEDHERGQIAGDEEA